MRQVWKTAMLGFFEKYHAWQKIAENDDRKWRKFLHNWRETTENGNIFYRFPRLTGSSARYLTIFSALRIALAICIPFWSKNTTFLEKIVWGQVLKGGDYLRRKLVCGHLPKEYHQRWR